MLQNNIGTAIGSDGANINLRGQGREWKGSGTWWKVFNIYVFFQFTTHHEDDDLQNAHLIIWCLCVRGWGGSCWKDEGMDQAQFKNTIHILRWSSPERILNIALLYRVVEHESGPVGRRYWVGRIKGQIGKICKWKHCSKFICKDRTYVRVDLLLRGWAHPRPTTTMDGIYSLPLPLSLFLKESRHQFPIFCWQNSIQLLLTARSRVNILSRVARMSKSDRRRPPPRRMFMS